MPKDGYRSSALVNGSTVARAQQSDKPSLRPVFLVLALFLGAVGAAAGTTDGSGSGVQPTHGHQQGSHVAVLLTDRSMSGR
ncbi:MAG: hypothetical protein ACLPQS_09520 [Acidimicrobiales bacterium]